MTIAEFRNECIEVLGKHRRRDCTEWTVGYLLATLRHHGPKGEELRQRAIAALF